VVTVTMLRSAVQRKVQDKNQEQNKNLRESSVLRMYLLSVSQVVQAPATSTRRRRCGGACIGISYVSQ
jgi:hypothetical protein